MKVSTGKPWLLLPLQGHQPPPPPPPPPGPAEAPAGRRGRHRMARYQQHQQLAP